MDNKKFGIGILTITATILLAANFLVRQPVDAATVVRDRDYTAVTARAQGGGETLFVADTRTGMIAVFTYDQGSRSLRLAAARPVADAFAGR